MPLTQVLHISVQTKSNVYNSKIKLKLKARNDNRNLHCLNKSMRNSEFICTEKVKGNVPMNFA